MTISGEDVITTMLRQLAQLPGTDSSVICWCEKALASGYCGVRVEYHTDLNALRYRVKAIVDPRVPYGTIEEHHYTDGVPMSDKLESKLEEYLRSKIKARGGMVIKMVAIVAGTPDDLVVLPGGRFLVVELKTKKGVRSPLQVVIHDRWRRLGVPVATLHGQREIDQWLDTLDTPAYPRPQARVLRSDTDTR